MAGHRIIQHVNVMVDNLSEGVAFYRDVIGLELDHTPDHDFPSQFFKFDNGTQIHMNEFVDSKPFRAHFCIIVDDFNTVFRRMKKAGVIDIEPWGKVRRLDSGAMQMFSRDPSGNLVEIASRPDEIIDQDILDDDLIDIADDNQLYASGRDDHRRGA
jgi:lactoylglutathione lyase